MELFSLAFILFLIALLAIYFAIGRLAPKWQWVVLLIGSLVFYSIAGGWQSLAFIAETSLTTWVAGLALSRLDASCAEKRKAASDRAEKKAIKEAYTKRKRLVLIGGLVVCLGVLGYLKYWNVLLNYVGLEASTTSLGILLPLGISFYTFQSLSYLIDIYNAKYEPEKNYARYLLFVSFFPQLILGPINRFDLMATQLFEVHHADAERMRRAALRIGYGVFKKFAIANFLAGNVAAVFSNVDSSIPGSVVVCGIIMYSLYDYADFSGGIDMVLGIAELFGISMHPNFRQPYLSLSMADFWRRWHLSLGTWMRDYVFYPLALIKPMQSLSKWATKRFGKHIGRTLPPSIANILVFLVVGLWHGAQAHFLVWGFLNGFIIAVSDLLTPVYDKVNEKLRIPVHSLPWRIFCILRTFALVNFTRYFDAMERVQDGLICLYNTVFNFMPVPLETGLALKGVGYANHFGYSGYTIFALVVVLIISILSEKGIDVREKVLGLPFLARLALYLLLGFVTVVSFFYDTTGGGGFMYANF